MNFKQRYLKVALVILATMLASNATSTPLTIYWILVTAYWLLNIFIEIKEEEDE